MLVCSEQISLFQSVYSSTALPRVWKAPGRVNLIGEHTDYNQGLVLPMAIDRACFVATAPSASGVLRVRSIQMGESAEWPVDDIPAAEPHGHWSDRVVGTAWELARRGFAIAGQDVLIDSEVPLGGGLSSSAALGVALGLALGGTAFGGPPSGLELARLAWTVESDFVGVPCGIMDQFISANGQAGAAVLLDCRTLQWSAVRLPEDVAVVTVNSMIKRELSRSAYRARVEECACAARELGIASLRDAGRDELDSLAPMLHHPGNDTLRKRARHVVTENARVEAFAAAAERGDLPEMGRLVTESHVSLRDDYEVSCPELDFLVDTALAVPGVFGARMMGGGFGGSTVNLVRWDAVERFRSALTSEYQRFREITPDIHVCVASAGASQVTE
jgi:galactokinase